MFILYFKKFGKLNWFKEDFFFLGEFIYVVFIFIVFIFYELLGSNIKLYKNREFFWDFEINGFEIV